MSSVESQRNARSLSPPRSRRADSNSRVDVVENPLPSQSEASLMEGPLDRELKRTEREPGQQQQHKMRRISEDSSESPLVVGELSEDESDSSSEASTTASKKKDPMKAMFKIVKRDLSEVGARMVRAGSLSNPSRKQEKKGKKDSDGVASSPPKDGTDSVASGSSPASVDVVFAAASDKVPRRGNIAGTDDSGTADMDTLPTSAPVPRSKASRARSPSPQRGATGAASSSVAAGASGSTPVPATSASMLIKKNSKDFSTSKVASTATVTGFSAPGAAAAGASATSLLNTAAQKSSTNGTSRTQKSAPTGATSQKSANTSNASKGAASTASGSDESSTGPAVVGSAWLAQLEEAEREVLDEFRAEIRANTEMQPELCDDNTLLRFLRARNFSRAKATEMIMGYVRWRREFKEGMGVPAMIHSLDLSAFREYLNHDIVFMLEQDAFNRPVLWVRASRYRPKEHDFTQLVDLFVAYLECLTIFSPPPIDSVTLILDVHNVGWNNVDMKLTQAFLEIFQNYYPERLGQAYILHQPWIFSQLWRMIKPLLDKRTVKKIQFIKNLDEMFIDTNPEGGALRRENVPEILRGEGEDEPAIWKDRLLSVLKRDVWEAEMKVRAAGNFDRAHGLVSFFDDEEEEEQGDKADGKGPRRSSRSKGDDPDRRRRRRPRPRPDEAKETTTTPVIVQSAPLLSRPTAQTWPGWVAERPDLVALSLIVLFLLWQYWSLSVRVHDLELLLSRGYFPSPQ